VGVTGKLTVITEESVTVDAVLVGGRVTITPGDLAAALGWELAGAGLCRGDVCVPVADPAALSMDGRVDLAAVAEALGRPAVLDVAAGIMAIALDGEPRHRALDALEAPSFTLPDLDGAPHHLGEWRHRKKLLVAFSSWCGCRYDLPGWQALHDELEPAGFTALGVALDNAPEDVRPWVDGISFPVLIDAQHVVSELYAISNVPTVVWIDEEDRIVRPNGVAFGTDTVKPFTGVGAEPHLGAVRRWVLDGEAPMTAADARGAVGDLSEDEVLARLHFRVGAQALRQGDEATGRRHFTEAAQLAPHDWTVRRAAMPLIGEDPFGDQFFGMYEEWQKAGMPYHGLPAVTG
jgi:peroxiredoxin